MVPLRFFHSLKKANILYKIFFTTLFVAISVFALNNWLPQMPAPGSQITLRLAEALPDTNPVTISMRKFADLVEKKTGGGVKVKVYSSAQLGQEPDAIELVRLGIIDLTRINSVALANVSRSIGVFTLPYIFRNYDHKYKVLDGEMGHKVRTDMNQIGLIGFDYMEAGSRCFYTRAKPINSLEDLKGLKIRVQPSRITIRMIELLGAVPTPMNFGEVYSSLSTGVVDGAENDYVSYSTSGHYEVAPFYVEDNHLSPPAILIMNHAKFTSLSPEHQKAISEAAHEAALFERDFMRQSNLEAKEKMKAANVTISTIDTAPFRAAVKPIYDEFPSYSDMIAQIELVE